MCQPSCTTLKALILKLLDKLFRFGKQDWSRNGYVLVSSPRNHFSKASSTSWYLEEWNLFCFGSTATVVSLLVIAVWFLRIVERVFAGIWNSAAISFFFWWCIIHSSNNFNFLVETKRLIFCPLICCNVTKCPCDCTLSFVINESSLP